MTNGDKRRNRKRDKVSKRYKVRYDRLVAVVLVLVVLVVILSSCVKSCSKKKSNSNSAAPTSASNTDSTKESIVDNLESSDETRAIISGTPDGQKPSEAQFTTEIHKSTDINTGNLVLVNSDHDYKFADGDIELTVLYDNIDHDIFNVRDMVTSLDAETLEQLKALMSDFYAAEKNSDIYVIGGYRSVEEQNDNYYTGNSQFQGGYSDYHTGRTLDLAIVPSDGSSSGYYSPTSVYSWIDEHAAEYGFVVRFPEGKESFTSERARTYTYRYVGAPHATYMKQNSLCLEEYINKLKEHTKESPIEVTVGKKLYEIYYVPANATGDTEVPVPTNKTYTFSGNNVDGYIITVNMN